MSDDPVVTILGTSFTVLQVVEFALALCYLILVLWPLVQLFRTYIRSRGNGWTVQRTFFTLILISSLMRMVFFILVFKLDETYHFFVEDFHNYEPKGLLPAVSNLAGVMYFSTYSLLILFWAEIIHQAKNSSISTSQQSLRPIFLVTNLFVYVVTLILWLLQYFWADSGFLAKAPNVFLATIYFGTAIGFLVYGSRLYVMLRQFPIESKGRRSKLKEVGLVSIICVTCFTIRCVLMLYATFSEPGCGSDCVDERYYFILAFFVAVEILPSTMVLWILRKLPPKKEVKTTTTTNPKPSANVSYKPAGTEVTYAGNDGGYGPYGPYGPYGKETTQSVNT